MVFFWIFIVDFLQQQNGKWENLEEPRVRSESIEQFEEILATRSIAFAYMNLKIAKTTLATIQFEWKRDLVPKKR